MPSDVSRREFLRKCLAAAVAAPALPAIVEATASPRVEPATSATAWGDLDDRRWTLLAGLIPGTRVRFHFESYTRDELANHRGVAWLDDSTPPGKIDFVEIWPPERPGLIPA